LKHGYNAPGEAPKTRVGIVYENSFLEKEKGRSMGVEKINGPGKVRGRISHRFLEQGGGGGGSSMKQKKYKTS